MKRSYSSRARLIAAATITIGSAGCVPMSPPQCQIDAHQALQAELLFGLSIPQGGSVSPAQFDAFVASELSPRFGAGFTVLAGTGAWQGHAEGARLVVIIAPDSAATEQALQAVRAAYRSQFHQVSVGLITVQSCARF